VFSSAAVRDRSRKVKRPEPSPDAASNWPVIAARQSDVARGVTPASARSPTERPGLSLVIVTVITQEGGRLPRTRTDARGVSRARAASG
jgi:hypothetical protein